MGTYRAQLGEGEIRRHVELSQELWGGGQTVDERLKTLLSRMASVGPDAFSLVGLVDERGGELAASLKRYRFRMRVRGRALPAVGFGAVFTHPDYRRRGLAERLLRQVLEEERALRPATVGVLYSDIGPRYYERFGFRALPARRWRVAVGALPETGALPVREATRDDHRALLGWYERSTEDFPLSTARDERSWGLFRALNNVERDLILSTAEGEVGYVSVSPGADRWLWLDETGGDLPQDALWATVRRLAEAAACHEVRGWWVPGRLLPAGSEVEPREKGIPMVALPEAAVPIDEGDAEEAYFSSADHF